MNNNFWYQLTPYKSHPAKLTDIYDEYVELYDLETKQYIIIHNTKIEPIISGKNELKID